MRTQVFNLAKSLEVVAEYSLPPREAVRNAYAQLEKKDYNTWDYAKYDRLVVDGGLTVACGDYTAWKGGERPSEAEIKKFFRLGKTTRKGRVS